MHCQGSAWHRSSQRTYSRYALCCTRWGSVTGYGFPDATYFTSCSYSASSFIWGLVYERALRFGWKKPIASQLSRESSLAKREAEEPKERMLFISTSSTSSRSDHPAPQVSPPPTPKCQRHISSFFPAPCHSPTFSRIFSTTLSSIVFVRWKMVSLYSLEYLEWSNGNALSYPLFVWVLNEWNLIDNFRKMSWKT